MIAGLPRVRRAPRNEEEREFQKLFEKATTLLGRRALCSHDACGMAMCIRRLLPRNTSREVLSFTGACPGDFVAQRERE